MRWTAGNGSWPAFWLLSNANPTGSNSASLLVSELDIQEANGSQPYGLSDALHKNTSGGFGVPDQIGGGWQNMGRDLSGWHTYSALWTDTTITWYVDGVAAVTSPVFASTNQPMFMLFDMWTGGWTAPVDSTTPDNLVTEVDWARVWQKT